MPNEERISIVFMVAGMSSRFGGKIKQFARVGPEGETLIEYSIKQALNAGFEKIIFIVGEKTELHFKEMFGNSYNGIPVFYALQNFDARKRDRPWGTVDALVSAKEVVSENFAVCNGDDIYGENALRTAAKALKELKENEAIAIGYELGKVLPENGLANRGIFKLGKNNEVLGIAENFGVGKENLLQFGLNEKSLASMNLFGFSPKVLELLEQKLSEFKKLHLGDRKVECLLPVELAKLIKEGKLKISLLKTQDQWFGVTNPEDEEKVKQALSELENSKRQ